MYVDVFQRLWHLTGDGDGVMVFILVTTFVYILTARSAATPESILRRSTLAFSPGLLTVAIATFGAVFAQRSEDSYRLWPMYVVLSLLLLHIPLAIALIRRIRSLGFAASASYGLLSLMATHPSIISPVRRDCT